MKKTIAVLGTVALIVMLVRRAAADNDQKIRAAEKRIAVRQISTDQAEKRRRKDRKARQKRTEALSSRASDVAKDARKQLRG